MKLLKKEEDTVQKKEVKAILFDMDGVLVDSFDVWFNVVNDTLKFFGRKESTLQQFKQEFGHSVEIDMETHYKGLKKNNILKTYGTFFKKRINGVKLMPQAKTTLAKIKTKKIKIALITNSTRKITDMTLEKLKLKKYFDAVVTMDEVKHGKPAPDMVLSACKMLKVKKENVILVGDSINDILASRNAGIISVGYKREGYHMINHIQEILKFI